MLLCSLVKGKINCICTCGFLKTISAFKKEKNVDIQFKSGEVITLKNEYPINCESFFAKQLNKKEIEKLLQNEVTQIKMYTYKKYFEDVCKYGTQCSYSAILKLSDTV